MPGSHPGYRLTFSHHVSLGSSWLWQFLRISLLLMTLTVLRNTSKVFCRGPHGYNLPDVFPMSRQGLWVLGKKNPEVKCHCHHIISRVHRTQSLPLIVNLTIWPGLSLSVPPPHLFHTLLLGRSHNAKPHTIRIKNYTPPAWRHIIYINYFYFFCIGYLCILPLLHHYHSSIYSIIYLHLYECMDIDFIP